MELHTLYQIVLGIFDNLQRATLQGVVEVYRGRFSTNKSYSLGFLRFVTVNGLFGNGIGGRE